MDSAVITVYTWGGKKFGVQITSSCAECDVNLGILHDMQEKEFTGHAVTIIRRPWLTHFWESLAHGGWHAPVVLVNGRMFSQGTIIDRARLAQRVQDAITTPMQTLAPPTAPSPAPESHTAPRSRRLLWVFAIGTLVAVAGIVASGPRSGHAAFLINVSVLAAFLGGVLSVLSPCSAAMLPAFFAYAFRERAALLRMTFVFWLGLALVFIPLGFGANIVGTLVVQHRTVLFKVAGLVFLAYALWSLFGHARSRALPDAIRANPRSLASVFLMGVLTAFASGTCTAPILGAILTLAATQTSAAAAFILLGAYSLGLVLPLFLLAYGFDRFGWKNARWIQGRLWTITFPGSRTWLLHSSNLIAAILFLFLAWVFWFGRGTYLFLEPIARSGLIDIVYGANTRILELGRPAATIGLLTVIVVIGVLFLSRRRRAP